MNDLVVISHTESRPHSLIKKKSSQQTRPRIRQLRIRLRNGTAQHLKSLPPPSPPRILPQPDLLIPALNIKMVSLAVHLDVPIALDLLGVGSTATTARELAAWRGIDREGEQVLGFHEVGDQAAADEEVDETEAVGEEDGDEDNVEDALPRGGTTRGVTEDLEGPGEGLVLWFGEGGDRGGVIPEVDEGGVDGAEDKGAACQDGQRLGD